MKKFCLFSVNTKLLLRLITKSIIKFLDKFTERKLEVQKKIYEVIGVRVDQILQGHGTSNTGSLARRCFETPELFSEALEIEVKLILI